jgi:multiple sugar transport system substrate-binding protein
MLLEKSGSSRRFFASVFIIVLLTSLLAACSSGSGNNAGKGNTEEDAGATESTSEKGKVKISWMVWGNTETPEKAAEAFFQAYPEEKDSFEIEPLLGGPGDPDVAKKLRLAAASNETMPDIVMLNRTQLTEFAEAGILENLDDVMAPVEDNLVGAARALGFYKDHWVAFPNSVNIKTWFYRKDMFDDAGIDPASIKNVDDLIAAGKKLQEKFPDSYIWNLGKKIVDYDLGMIISGNGATFTDENGEYIVASDPGTRKAFEMYKTLNDSGVVADITDFSPDWEKALADGTIASSLIANWFKIFLPTYAPDLAGKWAVAEWPVLADADGGSEAGGSVLVIPKNAKNKEAAKEFLFKLFLTKEGALALNKVHARTPILKDALSDPQVMASHPYFGETLAQVEAKALDKVKVFNFTPAADIERTMSAQALTKYVNGDGSLDDILKQLESDLKNQVGNPFKQ